MVFYLYSDQYQNASAEQTSINDHAPGPIIAS